MVEIPIVAIYYKSGEPYMVSMYWMLLDCHSIRTEIYSATEDISKLAEKV